jgi:transcriptional regulator with XRE-family HTH domain
MDALYWESQMADNTNADRALPFEPLSDLVRVWSGNQGSISINADGVISITMPDKRTVNMLKKFKSVLLMDATPNLEDIAHQFGIKESEILVLNSAVPDNSRLTINCIETPGFGSRNLSEAAIARGDAIIEKVKEQDPHTKVIAYKNGAIVCDGYWGNHTRGSNEFVGTQTMVLVGAPFPNLGEIQDNYRAQHGHLVGFEEYYNHLVAAEIIQAVGRQRAHRFQSNFNIFHICTGINPSFLEHLGCRVNLIHAAQIDPSLGSVSQSKRYTLAQVAMQMAETGIKVTQAAIAEVLGVTQSAVSQILKEFRGGWQGFKKEILGDLLNNTKSALYFSKSAANLDDWAGFDVASAMILTIDLVRSQDWATLKTMLNESTPEKRHWATAIMLNLFGIAPPNSPES